MSGSPTSIPDPLKIVTVAEMRRLEQAADASGHSYAAMMERAGRAVADTVADAFPHPEELPVLVLVGPGNNGGDGLVCAHHLHRQGYKVHLYLWKRRIDPDHDDQGHFARLAEQGVPWAQAQEDPEQERLRAWLEQSRVVVDALLGTGANRPIEGLLAQVLDEVNRAREHRRRHPDRMPLDVVAVDCPSGLNCDTGTVDPATVPAAITVTFAYAKRGHYIFPGAGMVGRLVVADIGIDPALAAEIRTFALAPEYLAPLVPPRPRDSHKGTFGRVLGAVGSVNFPGAARLALAAMGRVGAGLVTGAVAQPVWNVVAAGLAEPTWLLLSHELGVIDEDAAALVHERLGDYDALLLGCGLTQEDPARAFVQALLDREASARPSVLPTAFRRGDLASQGPSSAADQGSNEGSPFGLLRRRGPGRGSAPPLPPTVIDADGLNNLARLDDWPRLLPEQTVLTPHPAEMARLCGLTVAQVVERRWDLAREKAREWGAVLLVKGPYTVIAHPDGRLAVLPVATPALATAGTGDVLAGAIAGLLAQGLEPFDAACLGAWLHGRAGLLCQEAVGPAGALAGDLLAHLPRALNELRTHQDRLP